MKTVAYVNAIIEIDIEELINAAMEIYGEDVTMEDIIEYVNEGMTYLENKKAKGVYTVCDGWAISGFEKTTYDQIEGVLDEIQKD